MASFCLFPLRYTVQLVIIFRIFCSIIGIFYIFFAFPILIPSKQNTYKFLPNIITTVSQGLVSPAFSLELFADTLLLMGLWGYNSACLVPWIVLNTLISCGLGAAVIHLVFPYIFPSQDEENNNPDKIEAALGEMENLMKIILLTTFLILQLSIVCAVVNIFLTVNKNMKYSVNNESKIEEESTIESRKSKDVEKEKPWNGPVPLMYITENDKKRDSWETLRFLYDEGKS